MNKAIFFDRDGTLNIDIGFAHKLEDLKLYEDVIESINKLKKFYKLFIVTNQSGIGRKIFSEKQFHEFNKALIEIFEQNNIKIQKTYFCPHLPNDNCDCRKPNIKFIKEAEKEFNLNLKESYTIGDKPLDIQLGKDAACNTIYLLTGHGVKNLEETRKLNPDYIAATLKQAANFIIFDKDNKIIKREKLKKEIESLKKENKKIVTLNGAFDILHKGHEKILKEAKKQGDILLVAINSDSSVKNSKGPNRPINNQINRAKMVANFDYVDYVVIFDERTPIPLLEIIKPDVHVNGSEYGHDCIESDIVKKHGGKIHIVELIDGLSTTKIIDVN